MKEKATLIDDTPPRSSVKGRLVFADPSVNRNQTQPLANTDIALVVTYLILDDQGHSTVMDPNHLMQDKTNKAVQAGGAAGQDQDKAFQEFSEGTMNEHWPRPVRMTKFEFRTLPTSIPCTPMFKKMVQTAGGEFYYLFNADGRLNLLRRRQQLIDSWLIRTDIDAAHQCGRTPVAYLDT